MLRVTELLEDGEWHDFEEVLAQLMKLIPPGRALRRTEAMRRYKSDAEERQRPFSQERQIASGKRAIAKDALAKPYIEIYPLGKVKNKRVRMTELPPKVRVERSRQESDVPRTG